MTSEQEARLQELWDKYGPDYSAYEKVGAVISWRLSLRQKRDENLNIFFWVTKLHENSAKPALFLYLCKIKNSKLDRKREREREREGEREKSVGMREEEKENNSFRYTEA